MAYLPGVESDGLSPGGLVVHGGVRRGSPAETDSPAATAASVFFGLTTLVDTPGSIVSDGGYDVLDIRQGAPVPLGGGICNALWIRRSGDISANDYGQETVLMQDYTASSQDVLHVAKSAGTGKALNVTGTAGFSAGIGRFGAAPPAAASAITGALSAVTDPAAKAVLTAIIAALVADGGATDGTS